MLKRGVRTANLDGDDVREGLNMDLGFSEQDRRENLRRVAHVAELFNDNGMFVIATFVSPTRDMRKLVRSLVNRFKLCYVKCSPETCESRDVKGMYRRARRGKIKNFTGIDAPYEEPRDAEITVDTERHNVAECTRQILKALGV